MRSDEPSPPDPAERRRIRRASIRFGAGIAAFFLVWIWIAHAVPLRPGPWSLPGAPDPFSLAWVRAYVPVVLLAGVACGFLYSRVVRVPEAPRDADGASEHDAA